MKSSHSYILLLAAFIFAGCGKKEGVTQQKNPGAGDVQSSEPSTAAELNRWYAEPPPGENAFPLLAQAFEAMQLKGPFTNTVPGLGKVKWDFGAEPLSAKMQADMKSFVADNEPALKLLHTAAEKDGFRSPIDLGNGFNVALPYLKKFRDAIHLLRVAATYQAEEGNSADAVRTVETMAHLSSLLAHEPLNISYLVVSAARAMTARTVERILSRTAFDEHELAALRESLRDAEQPNGLYNAYVGERAVYLDLYRSPSAKREANLRSFDQGTQTPAALRARPRDEAAWKADEAHFTRIMSKFIEAAQAPLPESRAIAANLERELTVKDHYLAQRLLTVAGDTLKRHLSSIAELRCAQAALAITQHRDQTGALPAKISDLSPELQQVYPTDPGDGRPILYLREQPNSFTIRSMIELNGKPIAHLISLPPQER